MASAVRKKDIKRSPLAEWLMLTIQFVEARWRTVLAVLLAVGLIGLAGASYWWYQNRREAEASLALARATAVLRGSQPGSPGSPDEAMKRYREVAQRYHGTQSAEEALIFLGNAQFDMGKLDDAFATYSEYLSAYPRGRFRMMGVLGKAYTQEAKSDFKGAAQTLSEALSRNADDPLAGEAYMSLARIDEELKKPEEAMRVYGQVVERYGQSQWAQHALQRMSALRK